MIMSATSYQKQWSDCQDMIRTGAVTYEDIVEEFNKRRKKKFEVASQWSLNDWFSILAKGGAAKKRFEQCFNPNSSRHFVYFRAIQGHSGSIAVDLELQDNFLLPEGFTEYICHVGNVSEVHSIIRSGLVLPGSTVDTVYVSDAVASGIFHSPSSWWWWTRTPRSTFPFWETTSGIDTVFSRVGLFSEWIHLPASVDGGLAVFTHGGRRSCDPQ